MGFDEFLSLRDRLPKAGFVWEMSADISAELERPLPKNYRGSRAPKKARASAGNSDGSSK
jgi:hypothetical protein